MPIEKHHCDYLRGQLFFLIGFLIVNTSLACEDGMEFIYSDSIVCYIERSDYKVVSKEANELLSCGPAAVSVGREMTVAYLADEDSPIETESSTSIFLRASRFSIDNVSYTLRFVDIAKANATLFNHQSGSQIPYEPNLLNRGDSVLICLYREGGMSGPYVCCDISINDFQCSNYQYLTLDGKKMDPASAISSYKALSSREVKNVHLIFTTRIIKDKDYYYGYLGGYGFYGILIRSTDGVNWESITTPESMETLSYVIEGAIGIDPVTSNLFFCGRGDDVMFCGFNADFKQIVPSRLLSGTTTSKPTFFVYHDRLYLIVNMQNDTEYSNGRRNTANIYRIDGETGELLLVKTLKCKEGCSYHSVLLVDDEIWVIFQTDGRHIALEDQGRSNLALFNLKMN